MSRGIQNINTITVIFKLQHGRGYGNTSVLLDLHPVGHSMSCGCLTFYTTRQVNGSSVEQELFCQGRLSGIRVRDNGKGPATIDLFCIITHYYSPPNISKIYFCRFDNLLSMMDLPLIQSFLQIPVGSRNSPVPSHQYRKKQAGFRDCREPPVLRT